MSYRDVVSSDFGRRSEASPDPYHTPGDITALSEARAGSFGVFQLQLVTERHDKRKLEDEVFQLKSALREANNRVEEVEDRWKTSLHECTEMEKLFLEQRHQIERIGEVSVARASHAESMLVAELRDQIAVLSKDLISERQHGQTPSFADRTPIPLTSSAQQDRSFDGSRTAAGLLHYAAPPTSTQTAARHVQRGLLDMALMEEEESRERSALYQSAMVSFYRDACRLHKQLFEFAAEAAKTQHHVEERQGHIAAAGKLKAQIIQIEERESSTTAALQRERDLTHSLRRDLKAAQERLVKIGDSVTNHRLPSPRGHSAVNNNASSYEVQTPQRSMIYTPLSPHVLSPQHSQVESAKLREATADFDIRLRAAQRERDGALRELSALEEEVVELRRLQQTAARLRSVSTTQESQQLADARTMIRHQEEQLVALAAEVRKLEAFTAGEREATRRLQNQLRGSVADGRRLAEVEDANVQLDKKIRHLQDVVRSTEDLLSEERGQKLALQDKITRLESQTHVIVPSASDSNVTLLRRKLEIAVTDIADLKAENSKLKASLAASHLLSDRSTSPPTRRQVTVLSTRDDYLRPSSRHVSPTRKGSVPRDHRVESWEEDVAYARKSSVNQISPPRQQRSVHSSRTSSPVRASRDVSGTRGYVPVDPYPARRESMSTATAHTDPRVEDEIRLLARRNAELESKLAEYDRLRLQPRKDAIVESRIPQSNSSTTPHQSSTTVMTSRRYLQEPRPDPRTSVSKTTTSGWRRAHSPESASEHASRSVTTSPGPASRHTSPESSRHHVNRAVKVESNTMSSSATRLLVNGTPPRNSVALKEPVGSGVSRPRRAVPGGSHAGKASPIADLRSP